MHKLSVVVPCYNEEKNIPLLLNRFKEAIGNREDIILIVVDNGSTDNSSAVINDLLPNYNFAKLCKVEVNEGYGFGILSGLQIAESDFLGWTHADLQTDPLDVVKAFDIIASQHYNPNIFLKGNRRGRPFSDSFFTFGMSMFESMYLGVGLNDINAQPNIFHRSFYEKWNNPPKDFSLDLYVYYTAIVSHCKVQRFPVVFPERIHGESKWNTGFKSKIKFIKRTLKFSKELKKRLRDKK